MNKGEVRYRIDWLNDDLILRTYKVRRFNRKTVTVSVRVCRYILDIETVRFKCVNCGYSTTRISYEHFNKLYTKEEVINKEIEKLKKALAVAVEVIPFVIVALRHLDVEGDADGELEDKRE